MVAVEEPHSAEGARVECLEREVSVEAEKWQQSLAERKTSQTASRQLAEDKEPFQDLQTEISTETAQLRKWRNLVTETAEGLKVAQADLVMQSALLEAVQKEMDAQTTERTE